MPTAITEQKFGILSDFMGDREDIPNIKMPNAYLPESSGVFLQRGLLRTMPGANEGAFVDDDSDKVQTPDANPIIRIWRHVSAAGIEYEFAFTKAHIYKWDETNKQYDTFWTCSADCELWDTVSIDGKIIATNGIDYVLVWDETTPGTIFVPLGSTSGLDLDGGTSYLQKAKYCSTCEGYLILGATAENGEYHGRRERWSSYNDVSDFNVNGNGDTYFKDFLEGSDCLKGFGNYSYGGTNYLVAFKENSRYVQWLVESMDVWSFDRLAGNVGLLATHSVCNNKEGDLYYIASDYTVRKFRGGIISMPKDITIRGINVTYQDYIESTFIDSYNQIWWSIPSSLSSMGNDKIVALNLDYNIWHEYPFAIRAFGDWTRQESYTIDGLDALSATIDGLDAELPYIDYVSNIAGFPLDICSDYSGYTYILHTSETEKGSSVTRHFVISTDMENKLALGYFKRISKIYVYVVGRSSEGPLSLFTKEDNEPSWQSLGDISLESGNKYALVEITPDIRARHFLIKGSATVLFDFIGLIFDFEADGDR
jgi:hypothetical protein